jgi:hypothetical protein
MTCEHRNDREIRRRGWYNAVATIIVTALSTTLLAGVSGPGLSPRIMTRFIPSFSRCASGLDELGRAADDARAAAHSAASADDDAHAKVSEADSQCRLWGRGEPSCTRALDAARRARSDADDASRRFRSSYGYLASKVSDVESACAGDLVIRGVAAEHQSTCSNLRAIVRANLEAGKVTTAEDYRSACQLLKLSDEECRVCTAPR